MSLTHLENKKFVEYTKIHKNLWRTLSLCDTNVNWFVKATSIRSNCNLLSEMTRFGNCLANLSSRAFLCDSMHIKSRAFGSVGLSTKWYVVSLHFLPPFIKFSSYLLFVQFFLSSIRVWTPLGNCRYRALFPILNRSAWLNRVSIYLLGNIVWSFELNETLDILFTSIRGWNRIFW